MKIAMGLVWLTACAIAQNALEPARLGTMLDRSGSVRAVHGIAASVTLGDAAIDGVISFACSREGCLYKTANTLTDGRRVTDAPPGAAILARDVVYFVESRQFVRWHCRGLTPLDLNVPETVLALRPAGEKLDIAVQRDPGIVVLRVRLDGGAPELRAQYPDAKGPALLLADAILLASADELILRRDDGTEQRFALTGAQAMFAASDELVEIRTAAGIFGLRITRGREILFQFPEPRP